MLEEDGWDTSVEGVDALLEFIKPIRTALSHDFVLLTKKNLDEQGKGFEALQGGVLLTPELGRLGDKLLKGESDVADLSDVGVLTQQVETILGDWMIDAIERSRGKMSAEELRQIPRVVEFLRKNFEKNALLTDWLGGRVDH